MIAKAAQKYGFVVWDEAGAITLRAENPKTTPNAVYLIRGRNFSKANPRGPFFNTSLGRNCSSCPWTMANPCLPNERAVSSAQMFFRPWKMDEFWRAVTKYIFGYYCHSESCPSIMKIYFQAVLVFLCGAMWHALRLWRQ